MCKQKTFQFANYKKLFRKLKFTIKQKAGRCANRGTIVTRHKGSSLHRPFIINYTKSKIATTYTEFVVVNLRYDASRSALLALIVNSLGVYQYILAPSDIVPGSKLYYSNSIFSPKMALSPGTNSSLRNIPTGTKIYNIESVPGQGGIYARSAGCFAKLMIKKQILGKQYAGLILPSKKLIYLPLMCHAFLGRVSNSTNKLKILRKAGVSRNCGIRPTVRGVAMNPIDHPHGGGEGKSSTSALPKTPWGKQAKWKKTTLNYKRLKYKILISKMNRFSISLRPNQLK
jgi:large subunit ribosomal protein L2